MHWITTSRSAMDCIHDGGLYDYNGDEKVLSPSDIRAILTLSGKALLTCLR